MADDNIDFKSTLAELLREVGYTVHEASVAAEALQQLEDHPCDLAILDISLSTDDPLELARRALSLNPDLRVLLLSGFEVETTVSREAEELGFRLESKPLGPRALAEVLRAFERGETVVHQDSSGSSIPSKTQTASPSTTDLRDLVEKTRRDAGADYAVLFENDPQRPSRVLWPYCAGIELADSEDLHATLLYSPVGEVLRDRRIVRIVDTRQVPRRVTYLMRAVAFSSCLGMPIEIPSRPQPYAFFLFSRRPHTFLESGLNDVTAACRQIGQRLFRQHEFDRFVGLQEELLQSRLRAGALHDIRNTLGSMAFKLNSLEHLVGKPAKEPKATLEAAHTDVLSIQTFAEQMEKTTSLLRELTEDTLLMPVDVNALVHRLVERQRLLASHLSVGLSFEPDQRVPASVLRSAQLQQVADNVILNALQWCQGRRAKQTEISTHYDPEDATLPIKIRISDTGPGIHRRLQADTIFELGFSRRQGGSGLGLFVSRALMDAMGGTVVVENSIMDVGTNFLISIPHNSGRL
ncbi:MAG TPA: ATP-binding protein [Thermoanaerobaculia bacterium]|nr:ATP-binding protein [Thermoanaerobaculia bacterium]